MKVLQEIRKALTTLKAKKSTPETYHELHHNIKKLSFMVQSMVWMVVDPNEVFDKLRAPPRVEGGNYEAVIRAVKNECLSALTDALKNNGTAAAAVSTTGGPPRKVSKVHPIQPMQAVGAYQGNYQRFPISQQGSRDIVKEAVETQCLEDLLAEC